MHRWLTSSRLYFWFLKHREWVWASVWLYSFFSIFLFFGLFILWLALPLCLYFVLVLPVAGYSTSFIGSETTGLTSYFIFIIGFWPIFWRLVVDSYWGPSAAVALMFGNEKWADAGHNFAANEKLKWKETYD